MLKNITEPVLIPDGLRSYRKTLNGKTYNSFLTLR
jgi:hypothetical protein